MCDLTLRIEQGRDGFLFVVQAAILALVDQFVVPDLSGQDCVPHVLVESLILDAGFEQARILA